MSRPDPRHKFVLPKFIFIPSVIFGMILVYLCGYGPSPLPYPLNYFEDLSLLIFRSRRVVQWVFIAASATHLTEAAFALKEARRLAMPAGLTAAWVISTTIFGYPSLKELYALSKKK